MRQFAAFLILTALFVVLVATRFAPSDGDRLAAVGRLTVAKLRAALPSEDRWTGPANALRRVLPNRLEDRVRSRLESDKSLAGIEFVILAEGTTVKLRGVVPDAAARARAVELAGMTIGVETVVDELAVPEH